MRRGCGLLVKAQATARVDVPTVPRQRCVRSFEQSDVGSVPVIETQMSSHWNEKRRHCLGPWFLTQPGVHISLALS